MREGATGRRIAQLRKRAGFTQQQLAEAMGVSVETVSRMERGVTFPSVSRLFQVAEKMGVELRDLFTFSDPATEQDMLIDEVVGMLRPRTVEEVRTVRDIVARVLVGFESVK